LNSKDRKAEIFENGPIPDRNDPEWWAIMQHYDETHGTRMIDITSSIFCALYFACANWDGTVDESVDGRLYFFPTPGWRSDTDEEDPREYSVDRYFDIQLAPEFLRFRHSSSRNDRLVSQDGYFLWQARYDQPLVLPQSFSFRVDRSAKRSILLELYSIGYTAERIVRGKKGRQAHENLCKLLGVRT
jgi:hypothetical protein